MLVDCDNCEVRGSACAGCVVSVLLGAPPSGVELDESERLALAVLADAGMVPRDFDGGVSVRRGLSLDAHYDMATPEDAETSADYIRDAVPGFHALLRGMNVIEDGNSVRLKLQVPPQELAQHLRPPEPEPAKPVAVEPKAPAKPQSVRIVGLDDGPREFPMPNH